MPTKLKRTTPSSRSGGIEVDSLAFKLPPKLAQSVKTTIGDWTENDKISRLWTLDAKLWSGADEGAWLGWLNIADQQLNSIHAFDSIIDESSSGRFSDALVIGMGGSSLCPEVLALTFGKRRNFPQLHVLDSTNPAQVRSFADKLDPKRTLYLVASKSGGTLEPNILKAAFMERAKQALGARKALEHFVIVTDPGSAMEDSARKEGIPQKHIFYGVRSIGGRFSALSNFGLVPAAVAGVDLAKFLGHARAMVQACSPGNPPGLNPGVVLGAILGESYKAGHDKLTLIASPGIHDLGAWLEQLIAESTGKEGKAIIPVDRESVGPPDVYGSDRLFVYLRLESEPAPDQDKAVARLERAGLPVVRIVLGEPYCIAQEFFRWEIATAIAGSIMTINPFNQPDVEASKVATRKLTSEYEQSGNLPAEAPIFQQDEIKLVTDEKNATALRKAVKGRATLGAFLKAHLDRLSAGDYFALLAYLEMSPENEGILQAIRHSVRDTKKVATCLGFGPRFLHSTGQAYKGGTNIGVFVQITSDHPVDLPVPGAKYTFGTVVDAQARGDFAVLAERERRALRVHLGGDVKSGLTRLAAAIQEALA